MTQQTAAAAIGGFVLGALVLYGTFALGWLQPYAADTPASTDTTSELAAGGDTDTNSSTTDASINAGLLDAREGAMSSVSMTVTNQPYGAVVVVDHVELAQEGWVVVHEVTDGYISNALGAARYAAGIHENVDISLLRATEPQHTYVIVLYADNGNSTFEINADRPIVDRVGNPVIRSFMTIGTSR